MKTAIKQVGIFYMIIIAFALFASLDARADGFYMDVGMAFSQYDVRGFQQTEGRKMGSDIGIVEIGYESGDWGAYKFHESVFSQYDAGLDTYGLRYTLIDSFIYVNIAVETHEYNKRGFQQSDGRKLGRELSKIDIGIKSGGWNFFISKQEAIFQKDKGLTMIGVKYRIIGE